MNEKEMRMEPERKQADRENPPGRQADTCGTGFGNRRDWESGFRTFGMK